MSKTKTGEVFFADEFGAIWKATSYVDEDGVVTTENELIQAEPEPEPAPEPVPEPEPTNGE